MKKKDLIVYKTTNLINEKIYVGQDSKNNPKYIGSGKPYFENALNKYGKENFKKEILEYCKDMDELNKREIFWIKELDAMNPNVGYNLNEGGGGNLGFHPSDITKKKISLSNKGQIPWMKGKHHSDETKQKLSESHKRKYLSEETKLKISQSHKGKSHTKETKQKLRDINLGKKHTEESKQKMRENNTRKGKHLSKEHKQKISDSLKGEKHWNYGKHRSKETKQKLSLSNKGQIPWNKGKKNCYSEETLQKMIVNSARYWKGKHLSEETKQKMSKNNARYWKGKHRSEETKQKISENYVGMKGKHHSEESKRKISESNIKYKIPKKELYDLYINQNKTQKEIGKNFNCSQSTIYKQLKKYNIKKT